MSDVYDITQQCSIRTRLATGRGDAGLGALYLKKNLGFDAKMKRAGRFSPTTVVSDPTNRQTRLSHRMLLKNIKLLTRN